MFFLSPSSLHESCGGRGPSSSLFTCSSSGFYSFLWFLTCMSLSLSCFFMLLCPAFSTNLLSLCTYLHMKPVYPVFVCISSLFPSHTFACLSLILVSLDNAMLMSHSMCGLCCKASCLHYVALSFPFLSTASQATTKKERVVSLMNKRVTQEATHLLMYSCRTIAF